MHAGKEEGLSSSWENTKSKTGLCSYSNCNCLILVFTCVCVSASLLTVGALLGTSSQQKLGHGHIIGHDGDIKGQEPLAVRSVEIQLLQTVL